MCGIAGFVGSGDLGDLIAMTAALSHRGPDGEGTYVDDELQAFVGHRRLAVIDLAGGHQPMWNEDGQVAVVFNGEIYNHGELRAELVMLGHVFRSDHSDTEVLVHGYEEWGGDLPLRLNGMFAFAVLDRRRRRLFLARDRFGEKPLYYMARPGLFAFASELGALARHREIDPTIDPRSVQKLLAYGYLPAPNALYRGCRKLPGGHILTLDLDGDSVPRISSYWEFRIEPDEELTDADEPRLIEELRGLLSDAVKRRLISDVPLGIFLSGGIDSSTCLAMAAAHRSAPSIETFTIGFEEPSFDESEHARTVADFFGTRHHERRLDLSKAKELVGSVLGRLDEPLGDPSILPTYLLSAFTREHVTVALSGDGGDELFAGYDPFRALGLATIYDRSVPRIVHRGFRRMVDLLPMSSRNMSLDYKLKRSLTGLSYPRPFWNPVWMSPLEPTDLADLMREPLPIEDLYGEAIEIWEGSRTGSLVDRTLEFFTRLYLPDDILMKSDRASMQVSLETRAVFLDNELVEFCRRLPYRFKFRNGRGKYLLRKAVAADLPRAILERPKKGFGVPLVKWLQDFERAPLDPIPGTNLHRAERFWSEHLTGIRDRRLFLWTWLSLQRVGANRQHCAEGHPAWN